MKNRKLVAADPSAPASTNTPAPPAPLPRDPVAPVAPLAISEFVAPKPPGASLFPALKSPRLLALQEGHRKSVPFTPASEFSFGGLDVFSEGNDSLAPPIMADIIRSSECAVCLQGVEGVIVLRGELCVTTVVMCACVYVACSVTRRCCERQ